MAANDQPFGVVPVVRGGEMMRFALKEVAKLDKGMDEWAILGCYRGSIAHGTYRPQDDPNSIDDKDLLFVCVPDVYHYVGMKRYGSHGRGTKEIKQDEYDVVIHEARKFISLLTKGNPNVLQILWTDRRHFVRLSDAGNLLIGNRHVFVGKHVYHSFTGYAHSQLHRMTHHAFEGYMGEKRKALVQKHGYDTKNAAHLIRLLNMGIEFLTVGDLQVTRPDRKMLLAIKDGEWKLEDVKAEADRLFTLAQETYVRSKLPERPDPQAANKLCADVVMLALTKRGEW